MEEGIVAINQRSMCNESAPNKYSKKPDEQAKLLCRIIITSLLSSSCANSPNLAHCQTYCKGVTDTYKHPGD